jgi:hypothetical protein
LAAWNAGSTDDLGAKVFRAMVNTVKYRCLLLNRFNPTCAKVVDA